MVINEKYLQKISFFDISASYTKILIERLFIRKYFCLKNIKNYFLSQLI
jgi:hypothetical protein